MNFKLPYGALRWVVLFWLAFSVVLICLSIAAANHLALGIPLFTLIMALCICLGSRGCGWAMLGLYVLGLVIIPLRTFVFSDEPVNWTFFAVQMGLRVWFVYALYRWLYHDYYRTPADSGEADAQGAERIED